MPGSSSAGWGSAGSSEFHLIDVDELPCEPQEQPQRRTGRLARLLGRGPWRRAAAAAPQPAGASAHLAPIPIVSLAASGDGCPAANPLSITPGGAAATGQPGSASLGEATVGTWLQQEQRGWDMPPLSHNGSSLCSGISICSTSQPGSGSSSAAHSRVSSCSWPLEGPGGPGGQDGGSSVNSSSSSRLLNLLMLQAEAGHAVAAEPHAPPAAGALGVECTPNPLLQQEQAALLSWRRHAWHAAEQRQPELLHRLLSPGWDDEQAASDAHLGAASAAPLASSGMAAAGSRPGKAAAFGKPTFGRLLAILAALAVAVLLLHAAHSNAAHRKLTEPRGGLVMYGDAAAMGGDAAAAALGAGSLLDSGGSSNSSSSGAPLQPALLNPGSLSRTTVHDQSTATQGLPRRLRLRRVVLLIEWG